MGPEFLDANDAVNWWRERGAMRILVRLDFGKYLWAGEGPPPDEPSTLSVFNPDDPRGRPEGAAKTSKERRRDFADAVSARRLSFALDEGRRLTRRREAVHLSKRELANRVGQSEQWLLDAESGKLSDQVTFSQWVDLVWATRPGWPEERRASKATNAGWVAHQGQYLREAEVLVNSVLGLYD
jgi:DNA-binding XRE family transcriptional regulator